MLTTIQRWGSSQGVWLPKTILDELMLQENDQVEIVTENDSIVIKKVARQRRAKKSLEALFAGYTGNYECAEWDTGKSVGKEVW
ncbi:MAG: AbrB/MazE/SpoVT family DNA-binding domain-containing protein [Spirochaetes bacterium]|nr:AbrB/MazE/SpoVT family DNA-binding domain-containing protein [Spirochaetota bacterium]